jgi:hypothetical protein
MPVFLPRRKPNDIARSNFFNRPTSALYPAAAGSDDQRLSKWMRVPSRARPRLKRNACAGGPRRSGALKERVDADCSREPIVLLLGRQPMYHLGMRHLRGLGGDNRSESAGHTS